MADTQPVSGAYGYQTDETKSNPFVFGLNQNTKLEKFEWIPNGGKGGAEQEALDIVFNIGGASKSYRMFPVTQAFKKGTSEVITDPNSQEMKDAFSDFNATVVHILHTFTEGDVVRTGLSRPMSSFKEFVNIAKSLLPTNFATIPLDIFLQYGWEIGEGQDKTYLDIPKKMSYGKWLTKTTFTDWVEVVVPNPTEKMTEALYYTRKNPDGTVIIDPNTGKEYRHIFVKNGWFMTHNFAIQQKTGNTSGYGTRPPAPTGGTPPPAQAGQPNPGTPPTAPAAAPTNVSW